MDGASGCPEVGQRQAGALHRSRYGRALFEYGYFLMQRFWWLLERIDMAMLGAVARYVRSSELMLPMPVC
jgi:hypothetical protein